ncbi:hypothetical protein FO519_003867 [Halicephalobus sp. NKZ332]|nr:hypothetical protein FO519_003867 [Halicephalobus sp. NKZ332]
MSIAFIVMGLCQSADAKAATLHSKQIDRDLQKIPERMVQKLLLLGPGEKTEVEERKGIVYSNTVRSALDIVHAMPSLGIPFEGQGVMDHARLIEKHVEDGLEFTPFPPGIKTALLTVWGDKGVQECFSQRNRFQLNDSAQYFLDSIERTSKKDYRPTDQDILHTRMPTTGVVKLDFLLKGIDFHVYDVGGQRSERRKWIHFFDDVNAIIFVVGISEYDQSLREDNKTNRLIEALELFDTISMSKFFVKSSMILFMNKKDLFEEKIKKTSLNVTFPSYKGGLDYNDGIEFLKNQFSKLYKTRQKLYIHETCATDTNQIQHIFNSVIDTIIQENLKDTGML